MPVSHHSASMFLRPQSLLAGFSSLLNATGYCRVTRRMKSSTPSEPFALGTMLRADTGRIYHVDEVLVDRRNPLLCVYRASAHGREYIVKNLIPGEFDYQQSLQKMLAAAPNVRTVDDTIRQLEIFIYPFLAGDLLRVSQKPLSTSTRKHILRQALLGLVEIHGKDVVHNDIKPDNILVDHADAGDEITVNAVQISDLDDAVIVPPGKYLRGPLCGNQMWRSPESWARSGQNQASDVFSFGIVIIYVMLNEMVFRVSDDQLKADNSWRYILRRHISYFADEDGLNGFLQHIGKDNPFFERIVAISQDFPPGDRRQPFSHWDYVEPDLRDLIGKMTNLDPARRISARDALNHHWFGH